MTSGLESWDAEYIDNPAWDAIEDLIEKIDGVEPVNEDENGQVDRLILTLRMVLGRRDTPSLFISPTMMSQLQTTVVQQLRPQIDAWTQNHQTVYLNSASSYLFNLLEVTRGWPISREQNLRNAAASLRETVKSSSSHLRSLQQAVEEASATFEEQLNSTHQRFDEREDQSIEQYRELEAKVTTANEELNELQTRVDNLVVQQQERFDKSEQARLETHQQLLAKHRAELASALDETDTSTHQMLQNQLASGQALVEDLEELKRKASNVVSVVATSTTSEWYKLHADQQRKTADTMRWIAVGLFVTAFCVTAIWVFLLDHESDSWKATVIKTTLTVSLLAAAAYLVNESSNHRDEEIKARSTELKLRALDPFIAPLAENQRDEILIAPARELFVTDGNHSAFLNPLVRKSETASDV